MPKSRFTINKLENQSLQELLSSQIEQCTRHHTRTCHGLPDITFTFACLKRVISQNQSGRDFLQFLHDVEDQKVSRSTFFEALKSQRRLAHVGEMSYLHHKFLSDHLLRRSKATRHAQAIVQRTSGALKKFLTIDGLFCRAYKQDITIALR